MARITHADWGTQWEQFARKLGSAAADAEKRMVKAGGDAAERSMKTTTGFNDDSGQLRAAIKRTEIKVSSTGVYCEVYPQGDNTEGQRLETIAFVLEYGRPGRTMRKGKGRKAKSVRILPMPPHPWMAKAVEDAQPAIESAMADEWQRLEREVTP